eukprot:909673-Prymnesium_polylepis.1
MIASCTPSNVTSCQLAPSSTSTDSTSTPKAWPASLNDPTRGVPANTCSMRPRWVDAAVADGVGDLHEGSAVADGLVAAV